MATLTNEQIEQKMQLLAEKMNEMKAIHDELQNCDREMLSDDDLDLITGGGKVGDFFKMIGKKIIDGLKKFDKKLGEERDRFLEAAGCLDDK